MVHKAFVIAATISAAFVASAQAPLTYMEAEGNRASTVLPLSWAVLAVSLIVILVILTLVTVGVVNRGRSVAREAIAGLPVGHTPSGLSWIYIGVGVTVVVLLGTIVWTMQVLAVTYLPPAKPKLTIAVTGHQWWWEAHYVGATPSGSFTTANEIHIPTGQPVLFRLKTADVIHSFWVPLLDGKIDTIPGQTNFTWLDASHPGTYRGQCTEYCGEQHAHMALYLVAQSPKDFEAWRKHQLEDPPVPGNPAKLAALNTFVSRCGSCHAVRGTPAGGSLGPDLSHLMDRTTIAAGTLPNTAGNLSAWIANPQGIKPGALMPTLELSGKELNQIRGFLETLK